MLNSSRRAETNCYYIPLLCKFYKGQVQSHMALPLISQDLHTLQHFGCCTHMYPAQGELCMAFPTRRGHSPQLCNFHYRPQWWSCLLHLISANKGQPCPGPQHQQRFRGILQRKNPAPLATPKLSPQSQGSTAPLSPSRTDRARAGASAHQERVCSWGRGRKRRHMHIASRSLFNFSSLNSFNCIS